MITYAQNYEDVLLNRVFADRTSGFYIDVGAFHPVVHSVTKLFYDRGWRGINIEPIPAAAELLARERKRDINLRIGLSNQVDTSKFYECPRSMELSTFSQEQADELRRQGFELIERSIPITTLARVCEEHAGQTIDFLKIDVESYERQVLEGADWSRYRPRVVVVEATRPTMSIPSHDHWEHLLLAADYLFAFFDGLNRYYVRAEDRQLIPLLAVPANYFDCFEVYEHVRQIEELRLAVTTSQASHVQTRSELCTVQAAHDEARSALMEVRRAMDESLGEIRNLQGQLESSQARLAPFLELGPIAIGVAGRLRRMSRQAPRIASLAKWIILIAHPPARRLVRHFHDARSNEPARPGSRPINGSAFVAAESPLSPNTSTFRLP